MKKIVASVLVISMLWAVPVFAKSGDIAGVYYSTDILTTLNGVGIDAINIGGETLISAEAMRDYGYSVVWNGEERTLDIYSKQDQKVTAEPNIENPTKPAGTVLGNYYETDIVTCIDGTPVTAFNIGGWTYIHAEKLREIGFDVIWDAKKWTLSVVSPELAGNVYSIPINMGQEQSEEGEGKFSLSYRNGNVNYTHDADHFNLSFSRNKDAYTLSLVFYQNQGLFYSTKLMQKLDGLCYDGLGIENHCSPEEKFDDIDKMLKILINHHRAKEIEIYKGGGNGHRDYYITINGIPHFKEEEVEEIFMVFDIEPGKGGSLEKE